MEITYIEKDRNHFVTGLSSRAFSEQAAIIFLLRFNIFFLYFYLKI